MIDWSSSDYLRNDNNLFYNPDIEGGVYMNSNDNINEHLCYKCTDKTKQVIIEPEKIESFTPQQPQAQMQVPVQAQMQVPVQAQMQMQPQAQMQMPVQVPMFMPFMQMPYKSNFLVGNFSNDTIILFVFIFLVLYLVFIEIRISDLYSKITRN